MKSLTIGSIVPLPMSFIGPAHEKLMLKLEIDQVIYFLHLGLFWYIFLFLKIALYFATKYFVPLLVWQNFLSALRKFKAAVD